ncbi:phosphotransferase [Streptomyces lincolnensis]|uniref:Phosphotransferase n=2 Tax=Streptomyces lincolnensis TaxID=1915 RepID=A0A1B1M257_STRLN|nr:phosphotransferase [Streptomyces lincolnensis]AXG51650.1 phosphotransferase [Streptomyces lincolnensis]
MCALKMRDGEVDVDAALVRRLVGEQFPEWSGRSVERLESSGTENAVFRLGADLLVRLPRHPGAVGDVEHEQVWLPRLGPGLPVATPEPVGVGVPGAGFAWPWSVYRWLEGRNPVVGALAEPELLAKDLAEFVGALRRIEPGDGPTGYRGVPLAARDPYLREALAQLEGRADTGAIAAVWEQALGLPVYGGPPVWAHGDLMAGNLLVDGGRLTGVIDFATVGVGDPAVDLIPAWCVLPAEARDVFREAVGADAAEWARGRAWALSIAVIALPFYWHTNPPVAQTSRHVIAEILAETR